jgi:hypothetical protein
VSERTVYNWEKAINRPEGKIWLRLGEALNIDALMLKNGSERLPAMLAPTVAEKPVQQRSKFRFKRDDGPAVSSTAEKPFEPGWLDDPDEVERAFLIGLRKTRSDR